MIEVTTFTAADTAKDDGSATSYDLKIQKFINQKRSNLGGHLKDIRYSIAYDGGQLVKSTMVLMEYDDNHPIKGEFGR